LEVVLAVVAEAGASFRSQPERYRKVFRCGLLLEEAVVAQKEKSLGPVALQ
jgi:hypothetical protein